ncbi:MAG: enolase C-terminal domain-like protein [Chloroflexota bacterium]
MRIHSSDFILSYTMKKIATIAETYHIPISPRNASGSINVLAGAHVMALVPNHYLVETSRAKLNAYDVFIDHPLDIRGDKLDLSDRPGLGIELDKEYMRAHAVAGYVRLRRVAKRAEKPYYTAAHNLADGRRSLHLCSL